MISELIPIAATLIGTLTLASLLAWMIGRKNTRAEAQDTIANLKSRINSWWGMVVIFFIVLALGPTASVVLFAFVSFFALREFITLIPTRRADHKPLFWAFFIILPVHYLLVGLGWYGLSSIFIPVYAFAFLPFRRVIAGDSEDFLASVARLQWGLLVCVYFVSHLPLLLQIPVPGFEGKNSLLLLFLVVCAQASDVFQYVWGKLLGKRKVAPTISPNKTLGGLVGGIGTTTLIGAGMSVITPFNFWQAALIALLVCTAGFLGGLVMSAIKRDLGAKDWGTAIPGHGGFMDRIDSLCFAAPLFFHLVNFFFSPGIPNRPSEAIWKSLPFFHNF
jgi:phosphatidate cytidylyltransferase